MAHQVRGQLFRVLLFQLAGIILIASCPTTEAQDGGVVVLHVTVANEKGKAVQGLGPDHFSVVADKRPQKIVSFRDGGGPVSLGILFDASGSLSQDNSKASLALRQQLAVGVDRLLKLGNPASEYFVLGFNSRVEMVEDWTSVQRPVVDKLSLLGFKGQTAFYDALYRGIEHVTTGHHSKHVLVVVSDGQDNASKHTFKEVRERLKNSDVVLYAVGLVIGAGRGSSVGEDGQGVLEELTRISGGQVLFLPDDSKAVNMDEVFELIANDLRTQYQIVIRPERTSGERKWRKIRIDTTPVDGSGRRTFTAVTRGGYYQ